MQRTGAQIVWECLVKEGVSVVFGYPGGAILPTYDAMLEYEAVRHVLVRHEQGAAHMADGYARASGRVGVAIATSGPGATNLTTGIATAMLDSSPTVFITGQVSSKVLGSDAFQEVDVTGITLPITKHNSLVTDVRHIARTIKEAFVIARSGRPGPVLVDITKDAQQAKTDFHYPDTVSLPGLHEPDPPDAESLAEAAELIAKARRPLILAGAGVIRSGASQALVDFAEKAGVPVGLTLLGIGGFPQSHPLCLGMMGMHGEAFVNQAIQEADLLLAFGMRFDDRVTGNLKTYAPHAKKIHVEIDPSEVGKNVKVDVALVADLLAALKALTPIVDRKTHDEWMATIEAWRSDTRSRDILHREHDGDGRLLAAHVMNDIWRTTGGNAIVVTDVGQHQMWEAQYYKHDRPRTLITSGGLGTMGFALPAAIGAKMARRDAEVWVDRRRRRLPDDPVRARDAPAGAARRQDRGHQQRLPRHGAAVAGVLPRQALRRDADALAGLREARRRPTTSRPTRSRAGPTWCRPSSSARAAKGPVLIEFQVQKEDAVYPMVPAGSDLHAMIRRPADAGAEVRS